MAERGEIDPWNIDIVELTDKFLKKLEEMKKLDLRISGRTLLYAAILLRMKSDTLVLGEEEEEENVEEFIELEEDFYDSAEYPEIKPVVRRFPRRPVTLQDLIEELKAAERVELRRYERRKKREERSKEDVTRIAHEEDVERSIESVRELLAREFEKRDTITFSYLVGEENSPKRKISVYLPLLYLAARGSIFLEQPEIFKEIYIKRRM
ncbi:MAG: segregation and condensation protein [Archaeoglobi archaeon]|nr:segregation/condensation protein A [Candidatus Mnemosynella bozhongmuii]MDK2781320.1 segregation and condensation protein [Archaeoglobi archaeon]